MAFGAAVVAADGDPDPAFWADGEVVLQLPFDGNFGGLDADAEGNLALAFDDLGRLIALVQLHFNETLDLFELVGYDFPACAFDPSLGVGGVVLLPTDADYGGDGFFEVSALSDGHLLVTGRE